jgi:hypothetical protein
MSDARRLYDESAGRLPVKRSGTLGRVGRLPDVRTNAR